MHESCRVTHRNRTRQTHGMSYGTHMNVSCHTYEWVMAHIWMSHVTHMNESRHIYEWVMSQTWMSHVTHMNESCHTYKWVMARIWMSLSRIWTNESRHIYEWVMSHTWMSDILHMNESRHTHARVTSHIRMSHATLTNESCHTHEWVTSPVWMSHITHERVTSHIWMSHATRVNESRHTSEWIVSNTTYFLTYWISHKTPHTRWSRGIGCRIFICLFPQKSHIIGGSFAERDLRLDGILCIFATLYLMVNDKPTRHVSLKWVRSWDRATGKQKPKIEEPS